MWRRCACERKRKRRNMKKINIIFPSYHKNETDLASVVVVVVAIIDDVSKFFFFFSLIISNQTHKTHTDIFWRKRHDIEADTHDK